MIKKTSRNEARIARHARIRTKVSGTSELPRLCVFRSLKNISVQSFFQEVLANVTRSKVLYNKVDIMWDYILHTVL